MNFKNILEEMQCAGNSAGSITDAASEHPAKIVEVKYGDEEVNLKEETNRRLAVRNILNETLQESISNKVLDVNTIKQLREESVDAAKSWILMNEEKSNNTAGKNLQRYELQKWTNGGGGDGTEKGGPSAYEAWRESIISKKRAARIEQENADRKKDYKHTKVGDTLDGQEDEFLQEWLEKQRKK